MRLRFSIIRVYRPTIEHAGYGLRLEDDTVRVGTIGTAISEPFLRASAMLKHVIDIGWTSVRLSVRPSHAGIVSKRLNILSCFLRHTIAHSSSFVCIKDIREIPTGSPPAGAPNRDGV